MKLSFSTVATPRWSWQDIVSAASDLGYAGIEVRGLGDDLFLPHSGQFMPENIPHIVSGLRSKNLCISCLASDTYVHDAAQDAEAALGSYIRLAASLGVAGIRVLADSWGAPGAPVDEDLVLRRLRALAAPASEAGVELWVESNGAWASSPRLRALLDGVASPFVAAVWDIHHPFRYFGETVAETTENIGKYIRHVHIKDSVMQGGKVVYKMLGFGDLPLAEALAALKAACYGGFISVEWVKRWEGELEDGGVVLPHALYRLQALLNGG
ncbi:MAG: sugar phosphate isomerase/epimerase [Oscillospiraceae bacterium]|jgi:fatty-acyl-CoA synthase|nr:sugar phosphate isomerase/epimerase [Oscillospiraceae bacterium]